MFELSLLICGLAVILCLWRVALGPTAYDRILAVNAVGSLVIIGITLHGFFMGRPEFIDIGLEAVSKGTDIEITLGLPSEHQISSLKR